MNHHVRFQIQLGGGFFDHVKVCIFLAFGGTFGLPQGPPRDRTLQNMTFGMSFDSLMTIARKRNGSKKSQSLGSDIKHHITLKVENQKVQILHKECP